MEEVYPDEIDITLTGSSLAILVIYRHLIVSGSIGDCTLVKLSQNLETMMPDKEIMNSGMSIAEAENREDIFAHLGEIRKNAQGKDCIYVKGREYPESPMINCLGCKVGRRIGMIDLKIFYTIIRSETIDKQCCLLL